MPKLMEKERTPFEEETVQNAPHSLARRLRESPTETIIEGAISVADRLTHRKGLTPEDTLWSVVGSARSTGTNDASEQKYTHLAQGRTVPKQ